MYPNDELKHHGILGQRWGVRRTPEQLGRIHAGIKRRDKKAKKRQDQDVKERRLMSDRELERKLNRIKMEKEFKSLTYEANHPGRAAVKKVVTNTVQKGTENVAKEVTKKMIADLFEKHVGGGAR